MSPMDVAEAIKREEDEKDAKAMAEAQKPDGETKTDQSTTSSSSSSSSNPPNAPAEVKKHRFWDWLKDSYSLLRSNSPGSWFAVLLTGLYKSVEGQLKIETGVEMRAGALEAALVGSKILLGDRPIKITLNRYNMIYFAPAVSPEGDSESCFSFCPRTWSAMSLWHKIHFAGSLVLAAFSSISAEDIESLKQEDLLEGVIKELTERYPSLAKHIVQERDQYLAQTIRSVPGPVVVAIVGAAHVPGIKVNWEKEIDMQELLAEPPPSVAISLTKKAVKLAFYLLIPVTLAYFFWWR
jgi:pheromone shutdown protein TraB